MREASPKSTRSGTTRASWHGSTRSSETRLSITTAAAAPSGARLEDEAESSFEPELRQNICTCMTDVLLRLKPEYADIVKAVELDERSIADVARENGLTTNNATVRLHHARAALRRRLVEVCGACSDHGCLDCTCRTEHYSAGPRPRFDRRATAVQSRASMLTGRKSKILWVAALVPLLAASVLPTRFRTLVCRFTGAVMEQETCCPSDGEAQTAQPAQLLGENCCVVKTVDLPKLLSERWAENAAPGQLALAAPLIFDDLVPVDRWVTTFHPVRPPPVGPPILLLKRSFLILSVAAPAVRRRRAIRRGQRRSLRVPHHSHAFPIRL